MFKAQQGYHLAHDQSTNCINLLLLSCDLSFLGRSVAVTRRL